MPKSELGMMRHGTVTWDGGRRRRQRMVTVTQDACTFVF